jgi:hypothetical protein
MNEILKTEESRQILETTLKKLIVDLGKIQIGTRKHFPYGWRKAKKGRTVWRLLEEIICQNLEQKADEYGFIQVSPSDSEVSVYDLRLTLKENNDRAYINIKSAVNDIKVSKDDISKAIGLIDFFDSNPNEKLYIATFVIRFNEDMTIELIDCHVMPITWLPDIYVNPSNNGNLQSSKYKNIESATKRINADFIKALKDEILVAKKKKQEKK